MTARRDVPNRLPIADDEPPGQSRVLLRRTVDLLLIAPLAERSIS